MKAIEDGVKRLEELQMIALISWGSTVSAEHFRAVLKQVVQEALKEVIDADNRKP